MEDEVSLRRFRPSDTGEIMRIHSESEEFFEETGVDEGFIKSIASRSDFIFFVAETKGRVAGFCGVLFLANVGRAEAGPIAVDARFRGRGIATKLLECVMAFLEGMRIQRVIVRIKAQNTGAMDYFLKRGFTQEGFFRRYTRKGEDALQLVRFL
ncbi:MAG: GNAT family N-acetyltransferase [Candidatus Altiarchaeota archaeon]|nr:GNAT family N-acetyltransferase [Candidatus Altiarchaeota archaeon]